MKEATRQIRRRTMRTKALLLAAIVIAIAGCSSGRIAMYTEPQPVPVSTAPVPPPGPVIDVPPEPVVTGTDKTTVTGVRPSTERTVPAEKQQFVFQARLDRLMIGAGGDAELSEAAVSRLAELGLRCVLLGTGQYDAPSEHYLAKAKGEPVDLLLILDGQAVQVDRFGDFYSYRAECKGKLLDAYTGTVISSTNLQKRGQRALEMDAAAKSALETAATEMAAYFSDELVRKVEHGLLTVRVVLTRVVSTEDLDRVRAWLLSQKGVEEVKVVSWAEKTGTAIMHIRAHPAQRDNLAGYLETVPGIVLKVTGIGQGVLSGHKQGEER